MNNNAVLDRQFLAAGQSRWERGTGMCSFSDRWRTRPSLHTQKWELCCNQLLTEREFTTATPLKQADSISEIELRSCGFVLRKPLSAHLFPLSVFDPEYSVRINARTKPSSVTSLFIQRFSLH